MPCQIHRYCKGVISSGLYCLYLVAIKLSRAKSQSSRALISRWGRVCREQNSVDLTQVDFIPIVCRLLGSISCGCSSAILLLTPSVLSACARLYRESISRTSTKLWFCAQRRVQDVQNRCLGTRPHCFKVIKPIG